LFDSTIPELGLWSCASGIPFLMKGCLLKLGLDGWLQVGFHPRACRAPAAGRRNPAAWPFGELGRGRPPGPIPQTPRARATARPIPLQTFGRSQTPRPGTATPKPQNRKPHLDTPPPNYKTPQTPRSTLVQAGDSDSRVIARLNENEGAFAALTPEAAAAQMPRLSAPLVRGARGAQGGEGAAGGGGEP
jgi:hypothetical protein